MRHRESASLTSAAEAFIIEEGRLLDSGRFEDWAALFAQDGFYWIPAALDQADPLNHISILYEDASVLQLRARRLAHPRAHSALPRPRTAHLIGSISIEPGQEAGVDALCRSAIMMAEHRPPEDRRLWAGQQIHKLRQTATGLRIVLKRVDLIDCDAPHRILSIPI